MDGCICITVNGIAGDICKLEAPRHWTLHNLRLHIENHCGILTAQQRLLVDCSVLVDDSAALSTLLPESEAFHGRLDTQMLQVSLVRRSPAQAKLLELFSKDPLESHTHLTEASEELKADKEIVMAAVSNNGHALLDAADELKADRDIVFAACRQNAHALQYAAADLRSDRDFVFLVARCNFHVLRFAEESLKADKAWMLKLVRQMPGALMYASDPLKEDADLRLAAAGLV